MPEIALE